MASGGLSFDAGGQGFKVSTGSTNADLDEQVVPEPGPDCLFQHGNAVCDQRRS